MEVIYDGDESRIVFFVKLYFSLSWVYKVWWTINKKYNMIN
jgi:hypothetical protein